MKAKWYLKRFPNHRKNDPKTKLKKKTKVDQKMTPKWSPWSSRARHWAQPWAALGRPWGDLGGPKGDQKWLRVAFWPNTSVLERFSTRFLSFWARFRDDFWPENHSNLCFRMVLRIATGATGTAHLDTAARPATTKQNHSTRSSHKLE